MSNNIFRIGGDQDAFQALAKLADGRKGYASEHMYVDYMGCSGPFSG